jgi:YqjK-like protein
MSKRTDALAARRLALIADIRSQRDTLAAQIDRSRQTLAIAQLALQGVALVKHKPLIAVAALGLIVLVGPRRIFSTIGDLVFNQNFFGQVRSGFELFGALSGAASTRAASQDESKPARGAAESV